MRTIKLLCVILTAAAATPALAQTPSAPNFAGIWAHPFFPGFEPPPSGPGPIRNRSRATNGVSDAYQFVGDYTNPVLKPEAAEVVKAHGEISLTGKVYPTPSNQCWPGGVPFVFWDFLMQMAQTPDEITMIYRQGNEVRRVRMNQPHPAQIKPSWYGDSIGHYEGDTLVVDTVGIKKGPFAMLDMFGTPFTDKLHVVERYRLVDYADVKDAVERNMKENTFFGPGSGGAVFDPNHRGKMLQLQFTVEDEGVFTSPWSATITYFPQLVEWTEIICSENKRGYAETDVALPQANKPDF